MELEDEMQQTILSYKNIISQIQQGENLSET
jgi:hypothetical protein